MFSNSCPNSSLSVIVPAYNEKHNIAQAIEEINSFLEIHKLGYEIIVIDDGSTDATQEAIEDLKKKFSNLSYIRHEENLGIGRSIKSGIAACRNEYILIFDADGQYDIRDLEAFFPHMNNGRDMVTGIRAKRSDKALRQAYSFLYKWLMHILFQIKYKDVNSSFKLARRDLFNKIKVSTDNAVFFLELMLELKKIKSECIEVPVHFYDRRSGKSKICTLRNIALASATFINLWLKNLSLWGNP